MNDLDANQRSELAQRLEQRQLQLQQAIDTLRQALAADANGTWPEVRDSVEDGDARMMSTLDLTQLGRHEDELREVQHARQRLRDGSYGRCEECDEPIPLQRLQALPEARLCLVHEEAWEKANPQPMRATG